MRFQAILGMLALSGAIALMSACHRNPPTTEEPAALASQRKPSVAAKTSALTPQPKSAPAAKSFYADDFSKRPSVQDMTALGRVMFADPALSASGKLACASCHDPNFAYGPRPKGAPIEGVRAIPSLRYVQNVPPFSEHHFDEAVDESEDQGPTGGHTWDGRADTLHDQARLPLFSPLEMANTSADDIVANVQRSGYASCFRKTFGDNVFDDKQRAFKGVLMALEVFQQSPQDFYPYNSKYDAWLRGQTKLSAAEMRGLKWFNAEDKGNCASCHPSRIQNGSFPQFTDYGHIALGVPRNKTAPADYTDLGLCGPQRTDLRDHANYCGLFRAPTLRNVTLRHTFFHNGVFHDLRRAIEFYVQRDTNPAKFYAHGQLDDLPEQYQGNLNRDPPFGGKVGDKPALSAKEITDVMAFLATLTDGYSLKAEAHPEPSGSTRKPSDECAQSAAAL
jgi:cytochrome c peroxidase